MMFPEQYRVTTGKMGTEPGGNGLFLIDRPGVYGKIKIAVIATNGMGWEHVSVSLQGINNNRCPTWDEMCFVKDLFFSEDDCVVQYHPPKSHYVNNHKYCLHLWRPLVQDMPVPPSILVGFVSKP